MQYYYLTVVRIHNTVSATGIQCDTDTLMAFTLLQRNYFTSYSYIALEVFCES